MAKHSFLPLSELPLSDNFMFGEVMRDPTICKLFLEELLQKKIDHIEFVNTEQDMSDSYSAHGIRLDVYLADSVGTRYNIEMQNVNYHDLERRSRYYQSGIDRRILEQGVPFEKLPESYIIFIGRFDYFKQGLALYERTSVLKDTDVQYDDGSHVMILNTKYKKGNVSRAVLEFLDWANKEDDSAADASTSLAKLTKERIINVRHDKSKVAAYMTYQQKILDERKEERLAMAASMRRLKPFLEKEGRLDEFMEAAMNVDKAEALFKEFNIKRSDNDEEE